MKNDIKKILFFILCPIKVKTIKTSCWVHWFEVPRGTEGYELGNFQVEVLPLVEVSRGRLGVGLLDKIMRSENHRKLLENQ